MFSIAKNILQVPFNFLLSEGFYISHGDTEKQPENTLCISSVPPCDMYLTFYNPCFLLRRTFSRFHSIFFFQRDFIFRTETQRNSRRILSVFPPCLRAICI